MRLRILNQPVSQALARKGIADAALSRLRTQADIEIAQAPPGTVDLAGYIAIAKGILDEMDAAAADYDRATAAYAAAGKRSVDDPDGFVAACVKQGLIPTVD